MPGTNSIQSFDVAVVGGGMVGPAVAFGLVRRGLSVAILDDGDDVLRVARGNFGLVWFQGKGLGMPAYVSWTRRSTELWPEFAVELKSNTGIDVAHRRRGGLELMLGDDEFAHRQHYLGQIFQQGGGAAYETEMIGRKDIEALLPNVRLGPDVVGASYSPIDGDANPLYLLRAMHAAFQRLGGRYLPRRRVGGIVKASDGYELRTTNGTISAGKVVLAAGHGIRDLGPPVGLDIPIRPQRGHILVTERTMPLLPLPMSAFRQTAEGSIMLGVSAEEAGFDDRVSSATLRDIAARARRTIPALAGLRIVRSWAALRVLTPDKCPVYAESKSHPGVFAIASHSGVTLAAANANMSAEWIVDGRPPPEFTAFGLERFSVQATA